MSQSSGEEKPAPKELNPEATSFVPKATPAATQSNGGKGKKTKGGKGHQESTQVIPPPYIPMMVPPPFNPYLMTPGFKPPVGKPPAPPSPPPQEKRGDKPDYETTVKNNSFTGSFGGPATGSFGASATTAPPAPAITPVVKGNKAPKGEKKAGEKKSGDATQFAAPEQNLPVVFIYGLPLAGSTTLAKQLADETNSVFLSAQSVGKATDTWTWMSTVLTKFQQMLSLAQKPIKSVIIDFPLKSLFELSYLVQWLKEHSIPMNAAIHVDDEGGALRRAVATVKSDEKEYETYLVAKYQRSAAVIKELKNFFESQGISETLTYAHEAQLKDTVLDLKLALAKARSRRHAKVCQSPPIPGWCRGMRPLLNADFYRATMDALLQAVWTGKKGAVTIPGSEDLLSKESWDELFNSANEGTSASSAPDGSVSSSVPVPSVRANAGTPGLLFYHPKVAGDKRPSRLYFAPKAQNMLFTIDAGLWPFSTVHKPCVLCCSVVAGSPAPTEETGKKVDPDDILNTIILIQDCVYWDGASTFGQNYSTRFGILEKHIDPEYDFEPFGFGRDPDVYPITKDGYPYDLILGLHKAAPVRSLANWKAAARTKDADIPVLDGSQEWKWGKTEGVFVFDASAPLSLYNPTHGTSWIPQSKMPLVFKHGEMSEVLDAKSVKVQLLTLTNPKNLKELAPLPIEINTVEIPLKLYEKRCGDLIEVRWIPARPVSSKKKEGDEQKQEKERSLGNAGKFSFVKFRPDRVNPDSWPSAIKSGVFLPHEQQITELAQWIKFAVEIIKPTSQALQELMAMGGGKKGNSQRKSHKEEENSPESSGRRSGGGKGRRSSRGSGKKASSEN